MRRREYIRRQTAALTFSRCAWFIRPTMHLLPLVSIVLTAVIIQSALGFGSTLVILALGALYYRVEMLVPLVVVLNLVLSAYLVLRHPRDVDWRALLRRFLPMMALGLPVGWGLFEVFAGDGLERIFGVCIVVLAGVELARIVVPAKQGRHLRPWARGGLLFAGGVMHGMYAAGGPMAVYVAGRDFADKGRFRITLSALWLALNVLLAAADVAAGQLGAHQAYELLWLVLPLILGTVAGEWLHDRVAPRLFKVVVLVVLVVAGINLAVGG